MARGGRAGKKDIIVADNRKARHNYFIEDRFEAGIELTGTEVKALREKGGNIGESYAEVKDGELFLVNAHIPEYQNAARENHHPTRVRKLLMHRREIDKLDGAIRQKGKTIVPLTLYFNERGIAKVEIALATGKQKHDKRQAKKDKDWRRQKERLLREKG